MRLFIQVGGGCLLLLQNVFDALHSGSRKKKSVPGNYNIFDMQRGKISRTIQFDPSRYLKPHVAIRLAKV